MNQSEIARSSSISVFFENQTAHSEMMLTVSNSQSVFTVIMAIQEAASSYCRDSWKLIMMTLVVVSNDISVGTPLEIRQFPGTETLYKISSCLQKHTYQIGRAHV